MDSLLSPSQMQTSASATDIETLLTDARKLAERRHFEESTTKLMMTLIRSAYLAGQIDSLRPHVA